MDGASIKDIYHERAFLHSTIDQVHVKVVVELQGKEHAQLIEQKLKEHGYDPKFDDASHNQHKAWDALRLVVIKLSIRTALSSSLIHLLQSIGGRRTRSQV